MLLFALLALVAAAGASDSPREVTVGSVIKLKHDKLKLRLHSHDVAYGSGSGQQSVTSNPVSEDANSFWVVKCPSSSPCPQGTVIKDGDVIRLQHTRTRKWLHSHLHQSPLSGNLEVSCYGSETQSDTGDNWRVLLEGKSKVWMREEKVKLQHVDTTGYLHSHRKEFGRPIAGQMEVCALYRPTAESTWVATEGVYFPKVGA